MTEKANEEEVTEEKKPESRRRTSDHRSKQIRDFLHSYQSILLDNCTIVPFGNHGHKDKMLKYEIITARDVMNKVFEKELYPFGWLTQTSCFFVRKTEDELCDSKCDLRDEQERRFYEAQERFMPSLWPERIEPTHSAEVQRQKTVRQEREFAAQFCGNQGCSDSLHLYYLLRSGLLFSMSSLEFMDHWFKVQKHAVYRNLDGRYATLPTKNVK